MNTLKPQFVPPLDENFMPACLFNRYYRSKVKQAQAAGKEVCRFAIAVEAAPRSIGRYDVDILTAAEDQEETWRFLERHLKFVLWLQGGYRVVVHGPQVFCRRFQQIYSPNGERAFDSGIMHKVYGRSLEIVIANREQEVPASQTNKQEIGGHLEGCRIGFDLGASDYKLAAVKDGKPVFSEEIPWNPAVQSDPSYHYQKIMEGLELAASKLPRVDAIGGSAAGIYINNQVKVASLFRAVPDDRFEAEVKDMFNRIAERWDVPLTVVNDGDVTALAGAMSLKTSNLLGIAMGSSEAVGYIDDEQRITGSLHELAFAPVDFYPDAPLDEWSGDRGGGALYFSQQAVNRLLPRAGIDLPDDVPVPEKLKEVQSLAEADDSRARSIFETIGVYLGYSLVHYHDYYKYDNVLLLGRVSSGAGGKVIVSKAREILEYAFPDLVGTIDLKVPDEKSRRVGQAVAAASLP
ncbi:MAG: ROK family protein, partial [Lentisphaeria bacterium]